MNSLEKIVTKIIINGSLTEHPGLFYGKTGIALFFFQLAKHTNNDLFLDYAMNLIEAIQKQISISLSVNYDIGLAGIGAGFEYFLQNDFFEVGDDNFFEEYDTIMYRSVMYEQYYNLSLQNGLTGMGRYFLFRLCGKYNKDKKLHEAIKHVANEIARKMTKDIIPENEKPDVYRFFHDLTKIPDYTERYSNELQQCKKWKCICKLEIPELFPYMSNLQRLYTCQNYFNIDLSGEIVREWEKWEEKGNNSRSNMGLLNGLTSNALLYLTLSNKSNISWINLI